MVLPEATVAETIEVTSTVAPTPVAPSTTVPSPPMFPTTTVPAGDVILQTTTHHPSVHVSAVPLTAISMVSVMSANRPQLQRPALRVMCVVDTSGSMGQEGKIDAVRSALHYVVASLSPSDEFGLVSFSNSAVVNLAMTRVLPSSVPQIGATIARLPARGNTNLSGGLLTAIQVLHPAPRQSPYAPARCMPPTVQPYGVVSPIPSFYLMATRMPTPGPTGATVMVQGVLPAMASHLEVTAVGQLGAIRCTPGVPTAVWPDVPLTFTVVLKNPNSRASFAPQTVELHPEAPVHLSFTSSSVPPAPTNPTIVSPANAKALDLVLLFTDGEANVGVTDPSTLSALMTRTLAQCGSNASFVTFGFGTSHNATLLRTLATGTQGTYYFVPSSLDIPKLFGDCLGGFMSVVARNIVVRVQPVSSLVAVTGVRSSYPVSRDHTGVFRVQLKDLFAEERRDLIVDVTIDAAALVAPLPALPWFTVTVTSEDPRGVTTSSGAISVEVPVVQLPYVGVPNVAVEEQVGRLVAAEAIEAATNLATAGDFLHAREYLARARFAQPVAASSFARCVSSELAAMDDFMDAARWAKGGAMNANTMQAQHAQQRCSAVNAPSAAHYQTKAKSEGAARALAFAKNASAVPPS